MRIKRNLNVQLLFHLKLIKIPFSYLMFAPTIICKIAKSSSFEIKSSLSKSYILKATGNNNELVIRPFQSNFSVILLFPYISIFLA